MSFVASIAKQRKQTMNVLITDVVVHRLRRGRCRRRARGSLARSLATGSTRGRSRCGRARCSHSLTAK